MKKTRCLLLCLLFLSHNLVYAQSNKTKIRKIFDATFSGTVLVIQNGKVILHEGYGESNYELHVKNTTATKFRIGSLTKQFTSAAILLLCQEGKLNLENTLATLLPDCPGEWKDVTIYHLLTHTSGIPDLFQKLNAVPVALTSQELMRVIESPVDKKTDTIPGTKYRYNNFGYILLGYIIEKTTHLYYYDFLKKAILDPAGMNNTVYDNPVPIIANRAEGYRNMHDTLVNDSHSDPAAFSCGGLLSTTADFIRWNAFLQNNPVLNQETMTLMFTPYKNDYACGWKVYDKNGKRIQMHNGGTKGFVSTIMRIPEDKMAIVIFCNNESQAPWAYANKIYELLYPLKR